MYTNLRLDETLSLFLLTLLLLSVLTSAQVGGGGIGGGGDEDDFSIFSLDHQSLSFSEMDLIDKFFISFQYLCLGFFGLVFVLYYIYTVWRDWQNKKLKQQLFAGLESKCGESNPCTLDDTAMTKAKDWFMSQKWSIRFSTNNGIFKDDCRLTLKELTPRKHHRYNLKFTMTDGIGSSQCQGVLVHQGDSFCIMFEKAYNDRNKARQTGNYDMLLYEGTQQGKRFEGRWWYRGYDDSRMYSGKWDMYH